MKKKILFVFGTRPEAIKMAPVVRRFKAQSSEFKIQVCVTAQHRQMLDEVLEIFNIKPDFDLNIMQDGQTLFHITSTALLRMEKVLNEEKPDLVLVHGDTTTTFAAALASFYMNTAVGHVEAGLRSYDKKHPFPEEANRLLTDAICSIYFAPTSTAKNALLKENVDPKNIFVTGNTVIDALQAVLAQKNGFADLILKKMFPTPLPLTPNSFILLTSHRRENFGKPMENIFRALARVAQKYKNFKVIYPMHLNPNVQNPAKRILGKISNIYLIPPINYSDLANLMKLSYFVVTDSGGLQEEAPSLGKPVLVLRQVTERPEAIKAGTVKIIGTQENKVFSEIVKLIEDKKLYFKMAHCVNPYGDGKASGRIFEAIRYYFGLRNTRPEEFN